VSPKACSICLAITLVGLASPAACSKRSDREQLAPASTSPAVVELPPVGSEGPAGKFYVEDAGGLTDAPPTDASAGSNLLDAAVAHAPPARLAPEIRDGDTIRIDSWALSLGFAPTVAGRLGMIQCGDPEGICIDEHRRPWGEKLSLKGRVVFPTPCDGGEAPGCSGALFWAHPQIVGHIDDAPVGETVVLVQVFTTSNWCPNGPFVFLHVHEDGSIAYSSPMDACNGSAEVRRRGAFVLIHLYDQYGAHLTSGSGGSLPDITYTYDLIRRTFTTQR